jgi:predicted transglutaminase-like cysteine proteinase
LKKPHFRKILTADLNALQSVRAIVIPTTRKRPEKSGKNKNKVSTRNRAQRNRDMFKTMMMAMAALMTIGMATGDSAQAEYRYVRMIPAEISNGMMPKVSTGNVALANRLACIRKSADCLKATKTTVAATNRLRAIMASVNRKVERDQMVATASGTDMCLTCAEQKRSFLIQAGLPQAAMQIAAMRTDKGDTRPVLMINTTLGAVALDTMYQTLALRFPSTSAQAPLPFVD